MDHCYSAFRSSDGEPLSLPPTWQSTGYIVLDILLSILMSSVLERLDKVFFVLEDL